MKKLLVIPLLLLSLTGMAACTSGDPAGENERPAAGKILVAYFSAEGHTRAVAERIAELTGADIYGIVPAEPYAANPYDDSDKIKEEAYTDRRPGVAHLPATLPEDLDPDDITVPGRPDDAGIDMPGDARGTEAWLRRIGIIE